jgi:hypothetical protein
MRPRHRLFIDKAAVLNGPAPFRPRVERLERRELLTATMAEYAIPTGNSGAIDSARGPNGNL